MAKTYRVTWGPYSEVVEARDEPEAFARFCDRIGYRNPDVERYPKKHERIIEEIQDATDQGPAAAAVDEGPAAAAADEGPAAEGAAEEPVRSGQLGGARAGQGTAKRGKRKA